MRDKKGKFLKGHKAKGGRPVGSKSQKTRDWEEMREHIKGELVPKYVRKVKRMMDSGNDEKEEKGMDKLLHILEYFAPKLSRAELSSDPEKPVSFQVNIVDNPESEK